jgi:4-hydroxy-4-methyl-2-oxoglutarate aldolase
LSSTLASEAAGGEGVLDPILRSLRTGAAVAAPAATVRVSLDDNLDVRLALQSGGLRGRVLVVAGGSQSRAACLGGNIARELADAGILAVVTDAPVRDSAEVAALGLSVWSRGLTPIGPGKAGGGEVGGKVELAGVTVRPSDWVIADDHGIVAWPQERLDELTSRPSELYDADERAVG